MASPQGLRLFFASSLPGDVLDNIFAYGFHVWLAKPVDFVERIGYDEGRDLTGYTTKLFVMEYSLSRHAAMVVGYDMYAYRIVDPMFPIDYARPRTWRAPFEWERYGNEWRAVPRWQPPRSDVEGMGDGW